MIGNDENSMTAWVAKTKGPKKRELSTVKKKHFFFSNFTKSKDTSIVYKVTKVLFIFFKISDFFENLRYRK